MAKKEELMDWGDEPKDQEQANIDLNEMNKLVEQYAEVRDAKTEVNAELKDLNERQAELEKKILEHLEGAELEQFRGAKGLISIRETFSVKVPRTAEDKKALFEYLKKKGIFVEMVSVNSATLNSFYKEELEVAKQKGDIDFKIPGIGEPTGSKSLAWKKATN